MKQTSTEQLFSDAYNSYADAIFRHCYFRIGDRERGKELMQETFMRSWEYAAKGNVVEDLRAFLYRTANNLIVDQLRRKKLRKVTSLEDLQEGGFDIASDDDAATLAKRGFSEQQVTNVLAKIDEPYRTALIMRYIDELTPTQISEALDIPPNTVSVRVNRGMKKLSAYLKNYG